MTAEEFEREYARRSGVTLDWLRRWRTVLPCRCGEVGCEGWQSVSHELAVDPVIRRRAGLEPLAEAEA